MLLTIKFYEKTFTDENLEVKKAYLKACKWYYSKVLKNDRLNEVKVEYEINKEKAEVTASLYCTLDSNEIKETHCKACREFHWKVFDNSFFNCNTCNFIAVQNKSKQKLSIKKCYYSDIINNINRAK